MVTMPKGLREKTLDKEAEPSNLSDWEDFNPTLEYRKNLGIYAYDKDSYIAIHDFESLIEMPSSWSFQNPNNYRIIRIYRWQRRKLIQNPQNGTLQDKLD